jgi:hypothetical protein
MGGGELPGDAADGMVVAERGRRRVGGGRRRRGAEARGEAEAEAAQGTRARRRRCRCRGRRWEELRGGGDAFRIFCRSALLCFCLDLFTLFCPHCLLCVGDGLVV